MTEKEREIYSLIRLRYNGEIRTEWDEEREDEYIAIIDVIAFLTSAEYQDAEEEWKHLKNQLYREGCEWVKNIPSLPLWSSYWNEEQLTEVATSAQIYRITQSLSSPKAELLKQWMADTATYREEEMSNPELLIYRGLGELVEKVRLQPNLGEETLNVLKDFGKRLATLDKIPDWEECRRLCFPLGVPQTIPQPSLFDGIEE